MIAIPFIYFSILLIYQLRKNKWTFDIACLILGIYAVSGFFSILIDLFDLRYVDSSKYKITPIACFAYCGLLTMCACPFIKYSNRIIGVIRPLQKKRVVLLKFLAWMLFAYFFINFIFSYENIMNVITSDDMGQIRSSHYLGDDQEVWQDKLPFVTRIPFTLCNMLGSCSWLLLFLAFFCLSIQKLPFGYFFFYSFASFNGIISNLSTGGRSAIAYWVIGAIACYLFFLPYLEKKMKRGIMIFMGIVLVLFFAYLALMTMSRFDNTATGNVDGTQGSLIVYLGQSYINFCYFFDTFDCPLPTLQIIFPLTYKLIGYPVQGAVAVQELLSQMSGKDLNVFYTFIGQIITTTNNFVGIIFCLFFFMVSMVALKSVRKRRINVITSFSYMLFSSVLFLGLFGHYYSSSNNTAAIIIWFVILLSIRSNNKKSIIK